MRLHRSAVLAIVLSAGASLSNQAGLRHVTAQSLNGSDVIGVVATGNSEALRQAGVGWYLTYGFQGDVPAGMSRASVVRLLPTVDLNALKDAVTARPSNAWVIGNEPNVSTAETSDDLSPAEYAAQLNTLEATIHGVDKTAIIVGPNVLNWVDTCVGCGGYTLGLDWAQEFYSTYLSLYGTRPPIDRWSIHTYELNWENPPTLHAGFHQRQLSALRDWIDSIPAEAGKPIWDTEIGFHWAFPGWTFDAQHQVTPVGNYDDAGVKSWLGTILNWLSSDGVDLGIERSFLYAQAPASEGFTITYGGLALFEGNAANSSLTFAGRQLARFMRETRGRTAQLSSFLPLPLSPP